MSEEPAFFSSLEAVAAGFHTGRLLVIKDGYLSSKMVYFHEASHGRIFQECTDGNLHLSVLAALESDDFKHDHAQLVALNDFLFASTRDAHEKVATYLGVQSFSFEKEMTDAVRMLPTTYLGFYTFFDSLLREVPSSYVRYSIAWAAGRLAFNSGRAHKVDGRHLLNSVQSIPGPTERLDVIGQYLANLTSVDLTNLVEECASQAYEKTKLDPFSLMNDSDWEARIASNHRGIQEFDSAFLRALTLALSRRIPLAERSELVLDGYFAPVMRRFLVRRVPIKLGPDGTTDNYQHAFELAIQADAMKIQRANRLGESQYDEPTLLKWVIKNARKSIFVSAVEVAENRGHYKVFLESGQGVQASYAPGIPCVMTGTQFSRTCALVNEVRDEEGTPPIFLFTRRGGRHENEFAGLMGPDDVEWVFWRPGMKLTPKKHLQFVPFYFESSKWARLIELNSGTWTRVDTTIDVPQDGERFDLSIMFLFPQKADWIPHVRLLSRAAAALYTPLLQIPSIQEKLKYENFSNDGKVVVQATLALWEAFEQL